jgi:hypothetical protein
MARIDNDSPLSNRIIFYFGFCSIGGGAQDISLFFEKENVSSKYFDDLHLERDVHHRGMCGH